MKMFSFLAALFCVSIPAFATTVAQPVVGAVPGVGSNFGQDVAQFVVTGEGTAAEVADAIVATGFGSEYVKANGIYGERCGGEVYGCASGQPEVTKDPMHSDFAALVKAYAGRGADDEATLKAYLTEGFDAESIVVESQYFIPTDYTDDTLTITVFYNAKTGKAVAFIDFAPGC